MAKSAPNRPRPEVRAKRTQTLIRVSIDWIEIASLPQPSTIRTTSRGALPRAHGTLRSDHAPLGNCEFSASVAAGTLAAIASAWLVYCRATALPKLLQDLTIES